MERFPIACPNCGNHTVMAPVGDTPPPSSPWIVTACGGKFYPLDPRPEDVCVKDIATALANKCRFTGLINSFYSVAEHALRMSYLVPGRLALEALHHDSAEAYLPDIARPIKHLFPGFNEVELRVEEAISQTLGINVGLNMGPEEDREILRHWDNVLLVAEGVHFFGLNRVREWAIWQNGKYYDKSVLFAPIGQKRDHAAEFWRRHIQLIHRRNAVEHSKLFEK